MKLIFLSLFGIIVAYVSYALVHVGYFKGVEIIQLEKPLTFHLVYKEHLGSYHKINETINEVEKVLAKKNIGCRRSFGHFLDNPEVVPEDRLRSHAGCVTTKSIHVEEEGLKYKKIEEQKFVKASFAGSPALGPIKVYPEAKDFMRARRLSTSGPILEIYTLNGKALTTEFYFPY